LTRRVFYGSFINKRTTSIARKSCSWIIRSICRIGIVQHTGDNLTGLGEGDDEVIKIDLKKVPEEVKKIVITVTIHEAQQRRQNFGQVQNAFVRIVNAQNKQEAVRYDLVEDYSIETALIMAELYRKDGQWSLNAVGSGYQGGLQALLDRYS